MSEMKEIEHCGQFIITRSDSFPLLGWISLEIERGWFLHHHKKLSVRHKVDNNGISILIGNVAELRPQCGPIGEQFEEAAADDFETYSWAGRWILINKGHLCLDASGLLGIFYGVLPGMRAVVVTSSLALAARIDTPRHPTVPLHIANRGFGVDWLPPPVSAMAGFKRMLPHQILSFEHEEIYIESSNEFRKKIYNNVDAASAFADALVGGLKGYAGPFLLPLTAGLDSRTVLAALMESGQQYETFTHVYEGMSYADRFLPKKLAKEAGVSHIDLLDGEFSEELLTRYQMHSFGQCHQCSGFFAHDHYRHLKHRQDWIMLPGGCFEVGRCYYWDVLPEHLPQSPPAAAAEILEKMQPGLPCANLVKRGLCQWLESLNSRRLDDEIDWRDRFYLEQRLCGWLSTTEQATDSNGIKKLHIANSRYIYDLMLSIPVVDRQSGWIQRECIRRLRPSLLDMPVNPPPPRIVRAVRMLKNLVRRK